MGFFPGVRGGQNFEANLTEAIRERAEAAKDRPLDPAEGLAKTDALRKALEVASKAQGLSTVRDASYEHASHDVNDD